MKTVGVILAGGRSSRMGGADKAFARIEGISLLDRAVARLSAQVDAVAINANDPIPDQPLPVLPDASRTFDGPLAGVLAGLNWARSAGADRMATVAVDTPFFPVDLVRRLGEVETDRITIAASGGRTHPVFAIWPVASLQALKTFLDLGETRRVMTFLDSFGWKAVTFPDHPFDPFFNINTPRDLTTATEIAKLSS